MDGNLIGYLGWIGSAFIIVFYWLNGTGRAVLGYWCAIIGSALWVGVGVLLGLHSLVFIESIVIALCFRTLYNLKNWRK